MIQIKNAAVLSEIMAVSFHPTLIEILTWLDDRVNKLVITSGYRAGDSGVHGQIPCRGVDVRSSIFGEPGAIRDMINIAWVYDPERPLMQVCVYHKVQGGGLHFHIQAHDRTVKRG